MDWEMKLALGKILGEVYRTQRKVDAIAGDDSSSICRADDATIYGLLKGIEEVIDEEFGEKGVKNEQMESVVALLEDIADNNAKLKAFTGFYSIDHKLKDQGIDRQTALKIFRYLYATDQFTDVLKKLDSSNSPSEMRRIELKPSHL